VSGVKDFRRISRAINGCEKAGFSRVWQRNCPIIGYVLTLALDTSSPSGSLAFLRDDKLIAVVGTSSVEIYSSRVFRHLDFLLAELSLRLQDFDLFAVAAGPGSFTGLRVGLAAVKGWAEVFGKPIAALSALEAIAAQSRACTPNVISVMDARRGELYWGAYTRRESDKSAPLVLENDEVVGPRDEFIRAIMSSEAVEEIAIATPTPELVAGAISEVAKSAERPRRVSVERVSPVLAPEIGRLGFLRAQRGEVADALTLDANYIRRSDAELHWKGSSGS
jgi:tRNA threonylcarbamoyladenosine biosynthesis protein TsaB